MKFSTLSAARAAVALAFALPFGPAFGQASVLTQHNDNLRTGANLQETVLTPQNVNGATFGKVFTYGLDAAVNGQVLYVPNVTIHGVAHNVLYAYTSNNSDNSPSSLYALDADASSGTGLLWHRKLPPAAQWTTAAPVIDPATNTLFAIVKTPDDGGTNELIAVDITTGALKRGSPAVIRASVKGTGDASVKGYVSFASYHGNERPGLLFANGLLYLGYAHNSDSYPYHGWVFAFKYNGVSFARTAAFCTTPNGSEGGVWQAGQGLLADAAGDIYFSVGNGTFDANTSGGKDYGMCYVKLDPNLNVLDWFAMHDEQSLSDNDQDTGNVGLAAIPGTDRLFSGGTKFGSAFVLDSSNLGKFTPGGPDHVVNRVDGMSPVDKPGQNPVVWDAGDTVKYIYVWPNSGNLEQFRYIPGAPNGGLDTTGSLSPAGIYKQAGGFGPYGGTLAVTANGATNGILWAIDSQGDNGAGTVFHAFNAADVTQPELWDSNQNSSRDALGTVGHFEFPTVVNGKAYVPTGDGRVVVYGLLPGTHAKSAQ